MEWAEIHMGKLTNTVASKRHVKLIFTLSIYLIIIMSYLCKVLGLNPN